MSDPIQTSIDDLEKYKYVSTGPAKSDVAIKVTNPDGTNISTGGGGGSTLVPVETPTIYNIPMTLASTEYSQLLSTNTRRFSIKTRGSSSLQLAYAAGQSGVTFILIPPGAEYTENDLKLTGVTLYFQSPAAGQIAEIVEWI